VTYGGNMTFTTGTRARVARSPPTPGNAGGGTQAVSTNGSPPFAPSIAASAGNLVINAGSIVLNDDVTGRHHGQRDSDRGCGIHHRYGDAHWPNNVVLTSTTGVGTGTGCRLNTTADYLGGVFHGRSGVFQSTNGRADPGDDVQR